MISPSLSTRRFLGSKKRSGRYRRQDFRDPETYYNPPPAPPEEKARLINVLSWKPIAALLLFPFFMFGAQFIFAPPEIQDQWLEEIGYKPKQRKVDAEVSASSEQESTKSEK